MAENSDNRIDLVVMNPDKIIQSLENEIKLERINSFRDQLKSLMIRLNNAKEIVHNIEQEIDEVKKEFYVAIGD